MKINTMIDLWYHKRCRMCTANTNTKGICAFCWELKQQTRNYLRKHGVYARK